LAINAHLGRVRRRADDERGAVPVEVERDRARGTVEPV
jgi:hypothetical protein